MVRPKTYDEQLRAGLVRAAADRIAVSGAHGLSLRELAADQGTSTNAIYVMFGGKSQLVDAVLAQADAGFTHAQREALGAGRTLADRLHDGPLSPAHVAHLGRQVAEALVVVHAAGVGAAGGAAG